MGGVCLDSDIEQVTTQTPEVWSHVKCQILVV
jgi:hypothetical protein